MSKPAPSPSPREMEPTHNHLAAIMVAGKASLMPPVDLTVVSGLIEGHLGRPGAVIAILQAIQEEYRYIPREVFPLVSSRLGLSEAKIFSVATFYENFSLEPKGRTIIKVCDGTACHVRRSPPILARLRQDLGLAEGRHTTNDLEFTVETVACLGACGLAPVLTVNDKAYPAMTPDKATELVQTIRALNSKESDMTAKALKTIRVALSVEAAQLAGKTAQFGSEVSQSGDEVAKSGDEAAQSAGKAAPSGLEIAQSGDEVAKSGDEAAQSAGMAAQPGLEIAQSGEGEDGHA